MKVWSHLVLLLFSWVLCAEVSFAKVTGPAATPDTAWLEKRLAKTGLSKTFIGVSLETYEQDSFEKVLSLNLLNFLNMPGQHMNHVTPQAVRESLKFIRENEDAFQMAKEQYRVPPSVIASLLWIETRHGGDMGSFHTLSVYLHLLQIDRPQYRERLFALAWEKNRKNKIGFKKAELRKSLRERTKKKAKWAEEQLIALAGARKEKHLDLATLRGSFAGAFGYPQFIPSSYRAYAKTIEPGTTPDLTDPGDAILSVAYYLSKHGWKTRIPEAKVNALMKYNNSRDYADSIIEISRRVALKNQASASAAALKSRTISSEPSPESPAP